MTTVRNRPSKKSRTTLMISDTSVELILNKQVSFGRVYFVALFPGSPIFEKLRIGMGRRLQCHHLFIHRICLPLDWIKL